MSKHRRKRFKDFPCMENTFYTCACGRRWSLSLIVKRNMKNCLQCKQPLKQHGIAKMQDIMHEKRRQILTVRAIKRRQVQEEESN